MENHLSRLPVTRQLQQPTRNSAETSSLPPSVEGFVPAWPCSQWGLPGRDITTHAGGLLHRRFTLAPCQERFVSVALSERLLFPGR